MSQNKRGLHNGLNELLSDYNISNLANSSQAYQQLSIEQLTPGDYQPRRRFDETDLQELSNSIQAQGIIQPLPILFLLVSGFLDSVLGLYPEHFSGFSPSFLILS